MNTREIAAEYRLSHWAAIIRDRQESGLSVKAYCKKAGIHSNSYFYWQKKLREAACEGLASARLQTTSPEPPIFAEVKLPPQPALPPMAGTAQSHICVEAAGVRITAGNEYPVNKLAELLRTVMQPC